MYKQMLNMQTQLNFLSEAMETLLAEKQESSHGSDRRWSRQQEHHHHIPMTNIQANRGRNSSTSSRVLSSYTSRSKSFDSTPGIFSDSTFELTTQKSIPCQNLETRAGNDFA